MTNIFFIINDCEIDAAPFYSGPQLCYHHDRFVFLTHCLLVPGVFLPCCSGKRYIFSSCSYFRLKTTQTQPPQAQRKDWTLHTVQEQRFNFIFSLHVQLWMLTVGLVFALWTVTQRGKKLKQQQLDLWSKGHLPWRVICPSVATWGAPVGLSSNSRGHSTHEGAGQDLDTMYMCYRPCTRRLRLLLMQCRGKSEWMEEALVI